MAKQYLDDNGNPISAPTSSPATGGAAKVYLDDSGNPIQSTPTTPTPSEPGPLQSLANWGERTFPNISSAEAKSPQYQQYETFQNHPETARNILNLGSSYLRSLAAAPESIKQWATQSLTPQGSIQAIAERGNAPGTILKPGQRPAEPTMENVGEYATNLAGGIAAGATFGEAGAAGLRGTLAVPGAAKGIARALTGTGESATGKFIADVAEKNKAEQLRAAGVKGKSQADVIANAEKANREAAQKHLEQTQEALHETTGRELTHQQTVNAANEAANEANRTLDREHETAVQEALEKTRQAEDLHRGELGKARLQGEEEYQQKLKDVQEQRAKAEQDRRKELRTYMEKKSKILKDREAAETAASRKTAAAYGVERIDEPLRNDITETRDTVKEEAGKRYNTQRSELNKKQIPFNPADATNPDAVTSENIVEKITNAWDSSITGSEGRPPVIKSIAERINRNEPMTWRDLQGYRSEFSKKISSGTLPGDEYHAYTKALSVIDDGMQKIADANGMGRQVAADRAFYRQYMETFRDPSSPVYKAIHATERGGTLRALRSADRSGIEAIAKYNPELAARLNSGREALGIAKAPVRAGTLQSLPKLGPKPEPIPNPELPGEPQIAPPVRADIPNRPTPVQPTLPAPVERVEVPNRPRTILPKVAEETPEMRANLTRVTSETISQQKANAAFRATESVGGGRIPKSAIGMAHYLQRNAMGLIADTHWGREFINSLTNLTQEDINQAMRLPADQRSGFEAIIREAKRRGIPVGTGAVVGGVAGALRPAGQGNPQQ